MSIQFHTTATIPGSAENAYAALTDLEAWAGWRPDVVHTEMLTPGPLRIGSRWRELRIDHGREVREHLQVIAFSPPTTLGVIEYRADRFPAECIRIYTLIPHGDRVEIDVRGEIVGLTGVRKVLGRAAVETIRQECDRGLHALRTHLAARRTVPLRPVCRRGAGGG